jgi:aminoglycoside 2'-N-acetyltransferase I
VIPVSWFRLATSTGYVEAVATAPDLQRRGHGTAVMSEVNAYVAEAFEIGALGTGSHGFYERLGWQTWRGPSHVRRDTGLERTPAEDGYILVLVTRSSPHLTSPRRSVVSGGLVTSGRPVIGMELAHS